MKPCIGLLVCTLLVVGLLNIGSGFADDGLWPPAASAAVNIWRTTETRDTAVAVGSIWDNSVAVAAGTCFSGVCKAPEFLPVRHISAKTRVDGARYLLSGCIPGKRAFRPLARVVRAARR